MTEIPARVFLILEVEILEENITPAYWAAIDEHIETLPAALYLPWPVELRPLKEGQKICFSNMVDAYMEVDRFEYVYSKATGVTEEVYLRSQNPSKKFNLRALLYAATEGFMLDTKTLLSDVLQNAGLQLEHVNEN